jgi:hypothetical protein
MTANRKIRPNQTCISSESSQPAIALPSAGPRYSAAHIANNSAAIAIASFTKPRSRPMITETMIAITIIMSITGISDVEGFGRSSKQDGRKF